jgi:outer membrane protein assembly factor BamB
MYCYDLQGNLQWKKDLGVLDAGYYQVPDAQWGYASSPVIYDGSVIVQADVQQNAFLASFSLKDGKEQWRTKRDDVPTFGTPTIAEVNGRATIIVNGWKHIGGYDAETGLELWKLRGGGDIPAPTPVVAGNLAYITNAHGSMSPIYAIKLDSAGDISLKGDDTENAGVAWSSRRDGSYMPTPLVYGDYLYICRDNGIAVCFEAKTGKKVYEERLGTGRSGFTASVIAGDGKIYFTSEDGDIYVVKSGPKFELLATNPMGEVCMATPALSAGTLYYRTQSHLIALRETPVKKSAR